MFLPLAPGRVGFQDISCFSASTRAFSRSISSLRISLSEVAAFLLPFLLVGGSLLLTFPPVLVLAFEGPGFCCEDGFCCEALGLEGDFCWEAVGLKGGFFSDVVDFDGDFGPDGFLGSTALLCNPDADDWRPPGLFLSR